MMANKSSDKKLLNFYYYINNNLFLSPQTIYPRLLVTEMNSNKLRYIRDVGKMQSSWWGENILEVFRARFFKAMQRTIAKILSQTLVFLPLSRKLDCLVLGQCGTKHLPIKPLAAVMAHGWRMRRKQGHSGY